MKPIQQLLFTTVLFLHGCPSCEPVTTGQDAGDETRHDSAYLEAGADGAADRASAPDVVLDDAMVNDSAVLPDLVLDAGAEDVRSDAGAPDASSVDSGGGAVVGNCTDNDWCWVYPRPQGSCFLAATRNGDELVAAGCAGTVVHVTWTGSVPSYHTYLALAETTFNDLFAVAVDDVWAVGDGGAVFHYNGITWTREDVGTDRDLKGVSGTGPDDVWIVGSEVRLHYNGAEWQQEALTGLGQQIVALDDGSVFMTQDYWQLLRKEGASWETYLIDNGPGDAITGLWAASASDVVVATKWKTYHYQGPGSVSGGYLQGSFVDVPDWINGLGPGPGGSPLLLGIGFAVQEGGAVAATDDMSHAMYDSAVLGDGRTMVVGSGGYIGEYSPGSLTHRAGADDSVYEAVHGFHRRADGVLLAATRLGAIWSVTEQGVTTLAESSGMFGGSVLLGDTLLIRSGAGDDRWWTYRDGAGLTDITDNDWLQTQAAWGASEDDIWMIGGQYSYALGHSDGVTFEAVDLAHLGDPAGFSAIHGTSASNVWLAESSQSLLHYDGNDWSRVQTGASASAFVLSMRVSTNGDVWMTGDFDEGVWRWDGASLHEYSVPDRGWTSLLELNGDEVYLTMSGAGSSRVLFRFDGAAFVEEPIGHVTGITALYVEEEARWVGLHSGGILRRAIP